MSHKFAFSWDSFWLFPAVGILRGFETELVCQIGEQCFEAGLTCLEVTLNTRDGLKQIELLREMAPPSVNIGAGTVLTIADLDKALDAGAGFIVSPIVDEGLIRRCVERDVPIFPGAYTPTEIHRAWQAGAKVIKLFPSHHGGSRYLKAIKGPLDQIPLMAVGSVNLENIEEYLEAGACSVGLGSPLFDAKRMERKEWSWLKTQIHAFRDVFPGKL
jgi:2-dehydro-3-deoxyphosphogluconate aldolase / (4S)-4-hydroxy-2-oxoglutarate aldolase